MKKNNNEDKRLSQSSSINEIKIWKKPTLTQLDIKQTMVVECPSGMHWSDNDGTCVK